jgi:hypothetical protein
MERRRVDEPVNHENRYPGVKHVGSLQEFVSAREIKPPIPFE